MCEKHTKTKEWKKQNKEQVSKKRIYKVKKQSFLFHKEWKKKMEQEKENRKEEKMPWVILLENMM